MDCGCKGYGAVTPMDPIDVKSVALLGRGIVHPDVVLLRRKLNEKMPQAKLESLTSNEFDWDLEFTLNGFQYANGLPQTGLADKPTWALLLGMSEDNIAVYDPAEKKAPAPDSGGGGLWLVVAAAATWWALS